jgi:hypothetical protein
MKRAAACCPLLAAGPPAGPPCWPLLPSAPFCSLLLPSAAVCSLLLPSAPFCCPLLPSAAPCCLLLPLIKASAALPGGAGFQGNMAGNIAPSRGMAAGGMGSSGMGSRAAPAGIMAGAAGEACGRAGGGRGCLGCGAVWAVALSGLWRCLHSGAQRHSIHEPPQPTACMRCCQLRFCM